MKRLVMMLAAVSLLIGAAPYARTDPTQDAARKDKLEAARMAEEREIWRACTKIMNRPFPTMRQPFASTVRVPSFTTS